MVPAHRPDAQKAFSDALAAKPDGLILCGSDALENKAALLLFANKEVPVVGWHAGVRPGPIDGTPVAMNVTTDPLEVARLTAMAAVAQSNGRAGVVILTDSKYSIAMAKAKAMEDVIRACRECTLLEVRDVAISESGEKMPAITKELLQRYGKRWTHTLAINDIYFDYSIASLTSAAIPSDGISLLSAGDGSASAFLRIQAKTYQTVTVAEPLNQHGWQVMDELNRLFAGQPVSGFVAPIHLVNNDNIAFDGGKNSSTILTMAIETSIATNGIPDVGYDFPVWTPALATIAARTIHPGVPDAGAADPGRRCYGGLRTAHLKQRHSPVDG